MVFKASASCTQHGVAHGVEDRERVGDAIQDVETLSRGVQSQTARAAFGAGIDRGPRGCTHFDAGENLALRVDSRNAVGAKRGDVEKLAAGLANRKSGLGECHRLSRGIGQRAVINSRIQIERGYGSIRDGNPRQAIIHGVPAHARFEVHEVAGLRVRDEQIAAERVHGQTEVHGADAGEVTGDGERRRIAPFK